MKRLPHTPLEETVTCRTLVAELLAARTPVLFKAMGPSMNPSISDGDLVHVQPVDPRSVCLGQIFLFRTPQRLVLHRYVRAQPTETECRYVMVGDAAVTGFDLVSPGDLLGKAVKRQRDGKAYDLDTFASRWVGLLRFWLRPVRRLYVFASRNRQRT